MDNKRFYLRLIEESIVRMGTNSFLIKGWSLTAIGGLITLYITKINYSWARNLLLLCLAVCIIFWFNDAYYLYQERKFRKLYNKARRLREEDIDFNMSPPKDSKLCFLKCAFRPVFCSSYIIVLLILLILIVHEFHIHIVIR
ncbi:hypothetical protein JOD26_002157 [Limosilactobacillus caviae]